MIRPPMIEHRPNDVEGNLNAWLAEWQRIHPALRWMIAYWYAVAAFGGACVGLVIGLML